MNTLIKSKEIYWCDEHDRYVMIVRKSGDIAGLSYMQGDDLKCFEGNYSNIDKDLTNFYNAIKRYLNGTTELDRINQAIWAYFDYKNNY